MGYNTLITACGRGSEAHLCSWFFSTLLEQKLVPDGTVVGYIEVII